MNVLLDIHHHDLFRSLYILFHNRLKCKIYLPYGLAWNERFKYANYNSRCVVEQYLIGVQGWLNMGGDVPDVQFITVEEYMDTKMDIHVASLMENVSVFDSLIKNFKPYSKLIMQVGNNFPPSIIDSVGSNLMSSSTVVYNLSKTKNKIFYHQEFDTTFFHPKIPCDVKTINSFQHYFGSGCHPYIKDFQIFNDLKMCMPDFTFKCFGSGNEHGAILGKPLDVSEKIKDSGFVFHIKPQGDGYGYIYHNAYACGKPVIYKSEYLKYNELDMTPQLLFDEETSVDLSKHSIESGINKIREFTDNYTEVSQLVYSKFRNVVNFDEQFVKIKSFVENLI